MRPSVNMEPQRVNDLAKGYFDKKDFQSALDVLSSIELPQELIPNLAKCYYYTSKADKALELVLPLKKDHNLWIDVALYYAALGESRKAFDIYQSLDQSDPKVKFNTGWHLLAQNRFVEGFDHLQYGSECNAWGHEYVHLKQGTLNKSKRWQGDRCNHLVLILEGGLGDEMIFLRWANHLKTMCKHLSIVCSNSLIRLLTNSGYDCIPFNALEQIDYCYYVPAMTLPVIAKIQSPQEHVTFPYIRSFTERYIIKQMDMMAHGRKKIGIRFYGNPEFEHDQFRSPPRQALMDLKKYGQLFSLQIDEEEKDIPNCKHLIKDWQDTYSVFSGLDFLVTSCTSTAHLAGAMGIKAFVLVPFIPYFVWASDNLSWYPDNITVIRQSKYNDWSGAIQELNFRIGQL